MTVPARSPIPIPGSTADIIEVAGAVMTEEVEIKIQKYRREGIFVDVCLYLEQLPQD